jgi:hypothetical protein
LNAVRSCPKRLVSICLVVLRILKFLSVFIIILSVYTLYIKLERMSRVFTPLTGKHATIWTQSYRHLDLPRKTD